MRVEQLHSLRDELTKISAGRWRSYLDLFRTKGKDRKDEAKRFVASQDSDKWGDFLEKIKDPQFVRQLGRTGADKKLLQHAKSMHGLQEGSPVANIEGSSGKVYDVKRLPGGKLGCTCRDWRFRGSTNPGYECKHIRAFKAGKTKVAGFGKMTSSFFDELAKIQQGQQSEHEKSYQDDGESQKPFSTLLTQDDEPTLYNPRPAQAIEEPEVILGGNA